MAQKCLGYYQASAATAKSIADLIGTTAPVGPYFAYVQTTVQDARWRDDGTSPTASVGQLLTAGNTLVVHSGQTKNFKIIEATAGAIINVSLYRN